MTEHTTTRPTIHISVSTAHDDSTDWTEIGHTEREMQALWLAMVKAAVEAEYGDTHDISVAGNSGQIEGCRIHGYTADGQYDDRVTDIIEGIISTIVSPLEMSEAEIDAAIAKYC